MNNYISELFELLKSVDTPTVCNAIEVAQGNEVSTALHAVPCSIPNLAIPPLSGLRALPRSLALPHLLNLKMLSGRAVWIIFV